MKVGIGRVIGTGAVTALVLVMQFMAILSSSWESINLHVLLVILYFWVPNYDSQLIVVTH